MWFTCNNFLSQFFWLRFHMVLLNTHNMNACRRKQNQRWVYHFGFTVVLFYSSLFASCIFWDGKPPVRSIGYHCTRTACTASEGWVGKWGGSVERCFCEMIGWLRMLRVWNNKVDTEVHGLAHCTYITEGDVVNTPLARSIACLNGYTVNVTYYHLPFRINCCLYCYNVVEGL